MLGIHDDSVQTAFKTSTVVYDTSEDPPPVNNFRNVTFDDRGLEASARFDVSENLPFDPDVLDVTPKDCDLIHYGDVLSIDFHEPLIALSCSTSAQNTPHFDSVSVNVPTT